MGSATPFKICFDMIVRTHLDHVRRLARYFGARGEAEDVAQEVFIALHRAIVEGRIWSSDPWPWLRTTTWRITRDLLRTVRRQGNPTEIGEGGAFDRMDEHYDADVEGRVAAREELAIAERWLDGLESERRAVWVLKEIEGLTLPEIARDLGIPLGTAGTRLRLAREDLAEALRRHHAVGKRQLRGAGAILLPLDVDAIPRLLQAHPPALSAGAEERMLARIKKQIETSAPTYERPPGLPKPKPSANITAVLAFAAGFVAGPLAHSSSTSVPPPPVTPAPIMAAALVEDRDLPASLPTAAPAVPNSATASARVPPSPTGVDDDEMPCLKGIRAPVDTPIVNPREALRLLAQCEQRYPRNRYADVRRRIRLDAEAALSRR